MNSVFLICFVLGLVLSLAALLGGGARLHLGHLHLGHVHLGRLHLGKGPVGPVHRGGGFGAINGFTLAAFLCWFGGAGYLLRNFSTYLTPVVLLLAGAAGLLAASVLYLVLFKFLLPRERILSAESTRMDGVVARVSNPIRKNGGIGEILFSQADARRSAAARSAEDQEIPRGTEVVVLRYDKGIAYVSPLDPYHDEP